MGSLNIFEKSSKVTKNLPWVNFLEEVIILLYHFVQVFASKQDNLCTPMSSIANAPN